jgi:hypothetical protein
MCYTIIGMSFITTSYERKEGGKKREKDKGKEDR